MTSLLQFMPSRSPWDIFPESYALICGFLDKKTKQADISYFLTAKKSQPIGKITFSFIATMLGSWVFVTPAKFAISYGYIGIISVTLTNFFVMWMDTWIFGPCNFFSESMHSSAVSSIKKQSALISLIF